MGETRIEDIGCMVQFKGNKGVLAGLARDLPFARPDYHRH